VREPLHVEVVGPSDAIPIVTVHSGPGESHHLLRPWLDPLADEQHRVVYYDQRGRGGWRDHVADLRGVVGETKAVLLGHSWGALLALLYALEHRETLRGLVLVAPAPVRARDGAQVRQREAEAKIRPAVVEVQSRFLSAGASFAAAVAPYLFDPSSAGDLTPVRRDDAAAKEVRASLGDYDFAPQLSPLAGLPSLVIHGDSDPVPASLAEGTARLIGSKFELLARCGHAPFFEQPRAFLDLVRGFLAVLR
jgi:pimeloyl-ACP methyl ester carboxylesterase